MPTFALRCAAAALAACLCACATLLPPAPQVPPPRFEFARDTLAFQNYLQWSYGEGEQRIPNPDVSQNYTHRCFAMSRAVRLFKQHAHFAPDLPRLDAEAYRPLVRAVLERDPRAETRDPEPVVIPGYAGLREFSIGAEAVLKSENSSYMSAYFQRGNWRMVFPFTRAHQQRTADYLEDEIGQGGLPIIHMVRFPHVIIDHAVLVYRAEETPSEIRFDLYDPNHPEHPMLLTFARDSRTFMFAANNYFPGGRVDVYEIFRGWFF